MAQAAFSDNGKYYCALSQDGRLKIWDTETNVLKQEYTPDLHLTAPPSCVQWLSVSQSAVSPQKNAKRKTSTSENETQCIALGTTSGKIIIYSVSDAKIQTVLEKSSSKVTALDWSRKYGLYSCNKESFVYEWDLHSAYVKYKYNIRVDSKNKQGNYVSAIKLIPHKLDTPARYLVAASWQLRVWRLSGGECSVVRSLGHSAAPAALLALATHKQACWLLEGSQNERLLSFWDVTITEDQLPQTNGEEQPTKKQRKKSLSSAPVVSTPSYNFVLEDAPRLVDVELKEEDGATRLSLAAVTRSGVVHYYGHVLNGSSRKPLKPSVTLQASSAGAAPLPLRGARLGAGLLLGYSVGHDLHFERVTPDLSNKTQVLIRDGPAEKSKQIEAPEETSKLTTQAVTYVEPLGGVSRKRVAPGAQFEVPMESRLANLSLQVNSDTKSAVGENLTKLLIQGLNSQDETILRTVFQHRAARVAERSVSRVPPELLARLLAALADRATLNTAQCASSCVWVSAVLRAHAALLLAAAAPHLARMLAVYTHRRSQLCQLLNLKGRLELSLQQRGAAQHCAEQPPPVLDYHDTSSDSEMEVEAAEQSSEAGSWDDDKYDAHSDSEADT